MKRHLLAALLAAVVVISASVTGAMAYFTANTSASGGYNLEFSNEPEIEEKVENWTKKITIKNQSSEEGVEAFPVFVRVKAFCGADWKISFTGEGWTVKDDGYAYYALPLAQDEETTELQIPITKADGSQVTEEGEDFNVIVVFESTPVFYENGEATCDWSYILVSETASAPIEEGGVQE